MRTALLILLLSPLTLCASDYFVSPNGNDSNHGASASEPLRWIQSAINKAKEGSHIYLMPGVHSVKPGDKNITFAGVSGSAAHPITLTCTGAGVVVDLTDAMTGWGGIRISDDSKWIVFDGGGNPDPMDESTYWITIKNAAYNRATGDDRSTMCCRPVTIQSSSNIVIRNIFGAHSMGAIGCFGKASHDVLIENCRCVPGAKAKDDGVSHGIYVGTGADNVTIRNCFIKWGGNGRLGLQNNGGGKNVLLEHCCVTECCAAIKAFNGGHVNVRDCFFWNNFEKPMQGDVSAETPPAATAPPANFFTAWKPPAPTVGAVGAGGAAGAKPAAQPAPVPPQAPKPVAAAPTPPAAPVDPTAHREALRKMLQGEDAKQDLTISIRLFGKLDKVAYKGAEDSGIRVSIDGNILPVRWKEVCDEDLIQLSYACLESDGTALYHAAAFCAALKLDAIYKKISTRLAEVNPELLVALEELTSR